MFAANPYSLNSRQSFEEFLDLLARLLSPCPVLRPPAVLSRRTCELQDLGHIKADFFLDNFTQGNVRGAKIGNIRHHWPAAASVARVQLADTLRNHVNQDVWIKDCLQGLLDKESIHNITVITPP